jgi:protein-tyrosine phosphatase
MTPTVGRLASVDNFRDFGGQLTREGRTVVSGQLFRSAHFNAVGPEDARKLDALSVRFMVDLRHPDERALKPNRWSPPLTLASDPGRATAAVAAAATSEHSPAVGRSVMQSTYARVPLDSRFIALFGDIFRTLAERGGPVIIHCSLGKDRTGIACAVLLDTLGVSRAAIFEDYLATNATIDRVERSRAVRAELEPLHGPLSDETIEQVIGVDASYLQSSFDAIERQSGSLCAYVEHTLGIPPETLGAVRARLISDR